MGDVKGRFCFYNLLFFACLVVLVCYYYLNCASFLGDIVFPLFFFWLSQIFISSSDILFRKLSIAEYSLPFSFLYWSSLSIFVSIGILHFSFSFSFLKLCSIGLCPSLNCRFLWYTSLCISKHLWVSSSYLLHSISLYVILSSKKSNTFFFIWRWICYCIFYNFDPPFLLGFLVCLRLSTLYRSK